MSTAGIVLAAGASSRMGSNKLLLTLEGESLLRRAVGRALRAGLAPVVVVLGHEIERTRAELGDLAVDVAWNPDPTGPTSGSLHRGLDRLGPEVPSAVILLADMVLVTEEMLTALVRAVEGVPLAVSRYGDVLAPPLCFRRALFPELRAWTGEGCGKAVVKRHLDEARILDWPEEALADVDTPEDFRRLTEGP